MISAPKHSAFRTLPIRVVLALGLILTGIGCAATGPSLSPEGVKTREILGIVLAMERALGARDAEAFAGFFDWKEPKEGEDFKSRLMDPFARTSAIDLRMTVDRVVFEPGKITVALFWSGTWTLKDNPAPMAQNGNAVLVFSDAAPPRILQAAGDLPWTPLPSP